MSPSFAAIRSILIIKKRDVKVKLSAIKMMGSLISKVTQLSREKSFSSFIYIGLTFSIPFLIGQKFNFVILRS